ncbi:beta-galactosidase GalA [Novosphingobium profundi]|uniref:beta-galactosidase GalA n=1 Tax=Novosphingobium profundi TaxID=1774954 RepID=UPI001FEA56BD|nr:beta-galactosidase GalA [Novosphingobium profundi]
MTDSRSPRRVERLAGGWQFHLGHATDMTRDFGFGRNQRTFAKAGAQTADAAMPDFDADGWSEVRVPHDWAVNLPYAPPREPVPEAEADAVAAHGFKAIGRAYPENSVGWYRRALPVSAADKGRAVWLEFDGVFRDCIVFVNGYVVGGSASGYAPFRVDIADFLDYEGGPNLLALRVDATLGEGWFYEGAGIYRHVDLVSADPVHIPQWGVCVRATPDAEGAGVTVSVALANAAGTPVRARLEQRIEGPDGATVLTLPPAEIDLGARGEGEWSGTARLAAPRLWSPETPELYTLVSELVVDGARVDRVATRFGVRAIAFDAARGFLLNGTPRKLLGVCNHQDHAGVGTAIPDGLHAWRIEVMREMGVNAWRMAHNPAAQSLLDLCDETGVMMIPEARLNSTSPEAMGELERMILSSRNHPSVILWSLGNEEPQQASERGRRITAAMAARARELDPTRLTTQAFDRGWGEGASLAVDVVGFNYRTDQIAAFHAAHPDVPVIGSETGSTVATRGAYANDPAGHIVQAYDTEHPWWASTAQEWWTIAADSPNIAGGFIWTGFDYRGEPTPYPSWPSVSSYFGVADLCGFPKDDYYYYRAWWRPDQPLVHLLPHWTWPQKAGAGGKGEPVEVWVHANVEEVELVLNGRSLGRKAMPRNRHLVWKVPYVPGILEAHGYTGGRRIAGDVRRTAGAPAALRLASEVPGPLAPRLRAGAHDLAVLRVEVVDAQGTPVPDADSHITFDLTGPIRLLGVGNGDPTSHEPDQVPERRVFHALAQAIVEATGKAGRASVVARSAGLEPAQVEIFVHDAGAAGGS